MCAEIAVNKAKPIHPRSRRAVRFALAKLSIVVVNCVNVSLQLKKTDSNSLEGFLQQCVDFFFRKSSTLIHSRALGGRSFPGCRGTNNFFPEWKRAALYRARGIDFAPLIVKNAVTIGKFDETHPLIHFADVLADKIPLSHSQELGYPIDFLNRDPDISRRTSAAMSALGAFKTQSIFVPGHLITNLCRQVLSHSVSKAG